VFDALVNLETIRTWLFTEPESKFGIDLHVGGNPLAI